LERVLIEELEDIDDVRVINMLRGSFKQKKVVPRFRSRVDEKRYKSEYDNVRYNDLVNQVHVDLKLGVSHGK